MASGSAGSHAGVLSADRRTVCLTGFNLSGQLGNGTTTDSNIYGCLQQSVLPLTLLNFTVQQQNSTIALAWQTTNEVNTSYFTIQLSVNGKNFSSIGKVATKGDGNYGYTDDLSAIIPKPTAVYYRLQMVDKDGSFTYSKVVAVKLNATLQTLNLYPNPVKDNLFVQYTSTKAEKLTLQVTDLQGRLLQQEDMQVSIGTVSLSVNTAALPKGSYVLLIKTNGGLQQKQFVK